MVPHRNLQDGTVARDEDVRHWWRQKTDATMEMRVLRN